MRKKQFSHDNTKRKSLEGVISITSKGVGYVSIDNLKDDVEIRPGNTGFALDQDTVLIELNGSRERNRVLKVVGRARSRFVGTSTVRGRSTIVVPDSRRIHVVFEVSEKLLVGEKVFIELTEWSDPQKNPRAKVIKKLGKRGENDVEMEAIVLEKGFSSTFDSSILNEADKLKRESYHLDNSKSERRDFREVLTFTIDPHDAKDFDDALSVRTLANGNFEVGIHIADVSHYLKPKSALDTEAQNRGVSIYLVDRTIPMLPEVLSNDLCSLKPNEDKLTFSAVFELTSAGEVVERWFGRTIIHSNKRFTYENAQQSLDAQGEFHKELAILNSLAKKILAARFKAGAISFEQDEVKFELNETGAPIRVFRKVRTDSHKLVEEFMLLANREVATYVSKLLKSRKDRGFFVYRIHDHPNQDKITALGIFLKAIGYELKIEKGKVGTRDLNALFKQIEGEAEEGIIKTAAIRSMAKAIYSTKNIGHYGLGFDYYTHFTSPIRRYADVLVHRLLDHYLKGEIVAERDVVFYENMSARVTDREILAAEAERDSIKLKQVEYMSRFIGKSFKGTVSGVTEWGLYIEETETKCEGLVKMRDIGDDYYVLDSKNYRVRGEKSKKTFALGDAVNFRVIAADAERKTLDYKLRL